jgi:alpha-glucoside transport system ATP-binding protein
MADLKLENVSKSYGEVSVLKDINLDIQSGELIVFVGPSGCGKSTLLRMIAGLEKITGGSLDIDGVRVNDVPPANRGIAMVFQSYALYPHMTVRDNMAFALKIAKQSKEEIDTAVEKAAKMLQLTDYLDRLPKALSGGQRQRVAIARALILEPKVLLLDEPTSALDVSIQAEVLNLLSALRRDLGLTYIMVSHDLAVVAHMCDDIAIMNHGRIVERATATQLAEGTLEHPYSQQLFKAAGGYDRAVIDSFVDWD